MGTTKRSATVHTFSNGAGLVEFNDQVRPEEVNMFREMWIEAVSKTTPPMFHLLGMDITVVDHPNPFGGFDVNFEALSSAFKSIGMVVTDERIKDLLLALWTYRADIEKS